MKILKEIWFELALMVVAAVAVTLCAIGFIYLGRDLPTDQMLAVWFLGMVSCGTVIGVAIISFQQTIYAARAGGGSRDH